MTKSINSIFSKPAAARLRRAFGAVGAEDYALVLSHIENAVRSSEDHGVIPLNMALSLYGASLCDVSSVELPGYMGEFLVYQLKPQLVTGIGKALSYLVEHTDLYLPYDRTDPYMRDLDHLGDLEEDDPRFADLPNHHHWGDPLFLFTKARLLKELESDWGRLVHRTPYRPFPDWDPRKPNKLLDSQASKLVD
ncbi:MAG: hypothetical protein AAFP97_02020 [Pseudomonadota bacterium]